MSGARFELTFLDLSQSQHGILDIVASRLTQSFQRAVPRIQSRISEAAAEALRSSPEYSSLLNDRLRGELGVIDAAPVLEQVVANIQQGILVTNLGVRRSGEALEGGLKIEAIKGDYSEVLGVSGASFTSEGGFEIPWLRWLTLEGDRVLIGDFHFSAGFSPRSRTGLGVMARKGTWRVPPEFAGDAEDNWITRAFIASIDQFASILQEEIERSL